MHEDYFGNLTFLNREQLDDPFLTREMTGDREKNQTTAGIKEYENYFSQFTYPREINKIYDFKPTEPLPWFTKGDFPPIIPKSFYEKKPLEKFERIVPEVGRLRPDSRPRAEIVRGHNDFAETARMQLGIAGERGITITMQHAEGRTPLAAYLDGLSRQFYIVPLAQWDFNLKTLEGYTNTDHDEEFHFNRLAEIHPRTAEAIASFAKKGIRQLESGNRIGAEYTGAELDLYLSMLGTGNTEWLRNIAEEHFRHLHGSGVPNDLGEMERFVSELIETQLDFEMRVKKLRLGQGSFSFGSGDIVLSALQNIKNNRKKLDTAAS